MRRVRDTTKVVVPGAAGAGANVVTPRLALLLMLLTLGANGTASAGTTFVDEFRTGLNKMPVGTPVATIHEGHVLAYGLRLNPPFVFTQRGDSLYLNDVPYYPTWRPADTSPPAPAAASNPRYELSMSALHAIQGITSYDEQLAIFRDVYRQSALVEWAVDTPEGLRVKWNNSPYEEMIMLPGPLPVDVQRTMAEIHAEKVQLFTNAATRGMLIAFGSGYLLMVQPQGVAAVLGIYNRIMAGENVADAETAGTALSRSPRVLRDIRDQRALISQEP